VLVFISSCLGVTSDDFVFLLPRPFVPSLIYVHHLCNLGSGSSFSVASCALGATAGGAAIPSACELQGDGNLAGL